MRSFANLAPRAGFEPATDRLTVDCSTTELPGITASSSGGGPITNASLICQAVFEENVSILPRRLSKPICEACQKGRQSPNNRQRQTRRDVSKSIVQISCGPRRNPYWIEAFSPAATAVGANRAWWRLDSRRDTGILTRPGLLDAATWFAGFVSGCAEGAPLAQINRCADRAAQRKKAQANAIAGRQA